MKLALWALMLVTQSAANTFISRARNSGSYGMHAVAALFSNGIWIVNQLVSLDLLLEVLRRRELRSALPLIVVYTAASIVGSVGMHYVGKTYIEKGKRKVGG